jgi:hypothetical protein
MKIKNAKADPSKENMKFNFKNNKIIPMIIFISLAIIALSITIYFKVVQRMNTSMAL